MARVRVTIEVPESAVARVKALRKQLDLGGDPWAFVLLSGLATEERKVSPSVRAPHHDDDEADEHP